MLSELSRLFCDINFQDLRVRRPSPFVFFCGGVSSKQLPATCSLRNYLLNDRKIQKKIAASLVLAETANKLYRDTEYSDLISFEEDIATISAVVLVITESAGSLAELGAFASLSSIRQKLAVILQTEYDDAESFVRHGPIERLRREYDDRVAVYPWRINRKGHLIKCSVNPHVSAMVDFIARLVVGRHREEGFRVDHDMQSFFIILWILHLSRAISITSIVAIIKSLEALGVYDFWGKTNISVDSVKNKLFCMKIAGWVDKYAYDSKIYWFLTRDKDPFSRYSFSRGVVENDPIRRKALVTSGLVTELALPKHVRRHVTDIHQAEGS